MKNHKLTIKSQKINKTFQKVPSFSYEKLTPELFGMNNFKKNASSKFCIIGTGCPSHEDIGYYSYETFDEAFIKKEGYIDRHGASTQMSGLISINTKEIQGICPNSKLYHAKAFDKDGQGSYGAVAACILWGIISEVDCIIIPCKIKHRYDGLYSILKQAYKSNISIIAPISKKCKIKYDEILYVSDSQQELNGVVNLPEKNKIYTTHLDNSYTKAHDIYYKLAIASGLIEIVKHNGIKSNENAYETMLSYFQ